MPFSTSQLNKGIFIKNFYLMRLNAWNQFGPSSKFQIALFVQHRQYVGRLIVSVWVLWWQVCVPLGYRTQNVQRVIY